MKRMESNVLPLKEAAILLGLNYEALKTLVRRGQIPPVELKKGSRVFLGVDLDIARAYLNRESESWFDVLDGWRKALSSGWLSGRPVSPVGIANYEYGLSLYWRHVGKPELKRFDLEHLRIALSSFPEPDRVKRKCHYAAKMQVYKGFMSVGKYLITKKLKPKNFLDGIRELKPTRVIPERRTCVDATGFKQLLKGSEDKRYRKKTDADFDICLTKTLLSVAIMTGLRRAEILKLTLDDVDLKRAELYVRDGKGYKQRMVGMRPDLIEACEEWLKVRVTIETTSKAFFIQKDGSPITVYVIRGRLKRLREKTGIDITPHGFRRAFATIHADMGIPITHIQYSLGHTSLLTTQKYLIEDAQTAANSFKAMVFKDAPESVPVAEQINNYQKILDTLKD